MKLLDCARCKFPFYIVNKIAKLTENDENSKKVLEESNRKFQLYMGHRIRVENQKREIRRVHGRLARDCAERRVTEEAIVINDDKMKFEASYCREKNYRVQCEARNELAWSAGSILRF